MFSQSRVVLVVFDMWGRQSSTIAIGGVKTSVEVKNKKSTNAFLPTSAEKRNTDLTGRAVCVWIRRRIGGAETSKKR